MEVQWTSSGIPVEPSRVHWSSLESMEQGKVLVFMHVKSPYDSYDDSYMLDCTSDWWLKCHCLVYHHPCPSSATCQYLCSPFVTTYVLYYLLHCSILLHEFYQNLVSSLLVMHEFMFVSQLHVKPNLSLLNPEEQQSVKTHTLL